MSNPLVSIVLLTRNGGQTLQDTLAAIASQRTDFEFEVVAIDSGSTDATVELLKRAAHRVVTIAPDSFNHGLTRNLGVEHARGELIVLLVQDALPTDDEWLLRLTAPLRKNPRVAGAFCRQLPRPSASALTRLSLDTWVAASPAPRGICLKHPRELESLEPMERLRMCAFDNVCSCIRRSVWEHIPFSDTSIAEDVEWGRAALVAGYRLDYAADAVVLHSHERSARYELARTYLLHRRLFELFDLRTIPTFPHLVRAVVGATRLHLKYRRADARTGHTRTTVGRALALALVWPLGQYIGGLSAARGWKPVRFRTV